MPLTLAFAIAVFAICAVTLLRLGWLLTRRRPVVAQVIGSSFSDHDRLDHRALQRAALGRIAGAEQAEDERGTVDVRYEVNGRMYRTTVAISVRRGERPDPTIRLWYDPRDPASVREANPLKTGLALVGVVGAGIAALHGEIGLGPAWLGFQIRASPDNSLSISAGMSPVSVSPARSAGASRPER